MRMRINVLSATTWTRRMCHTRHHRMQQHLMTVTAASGVTTSTSVCAPASWAWDSPPTASVWTTVAACSSASRRRCVVWRVAAPAHVTLTTWVASTSRASTADDRPAVWTLILTSTLTSWIPSVLVRMLSIFAKPECFSIFCSKNCYRFWLLQIKQIVSRSLPSYFYCRNCCRFSSPLWRHHLANEDCAATNFPWFLLEYMCLVNVVCEWSFFQLTAQDERSTHFTDLTRTLNIFGAKN